MLVLCSCQISGKEKRRTKGNSEHSGLSDAVSAQYFYRTFKRANSAHTMCDLQYSVFFFFFAHYIPRRLLLLLTQTNQPVNGGLANVDSAHLQCRPRLVGKLS